MRARCQDCGHVDDVENLPEAKDVLERHTMGDIFSDVECPHCGAICLPVYSDKEVLDAGVGFINAELENMGLSLDTLTEIEKRNLAGDLADTAHNRIHEFAAAQQKTICSVTVRNTDD